MNRPIETEIKENDYTIQLLDDGSINVKLYFEGVKDINDLREFAGSLLNTAEELANYGEEQPDNDEWKF